MGYVYLGDTQQYACVDGVMLPVAVGPYVSVLDFEQLLKKYKRLVKLCRLMGTFEAYKELKKDGQNISDCGPEYQKKCIFLGEA